MGRAFSLLPAITHRATHAVRYQDILYSLYQDMLYTFGGRGHLPWGGRYALESDRSAGTEASPLQRHAWPLQGRYSVPERSIGSVSFVHDDRRSSARICGSVFPVSRVFAVNIRDRWAFTWRSLPTGRRKRRPYTDLSTPRRLGCPRRRPFRSSAGRHRHNLRKSAPSAVWRSRWTVAVNNHGRRLLA